MKRAYFLSFPAQRDLDKIWDYSFATWGMDRADAYVREIHVALALIASSPELGRDCDFIRKGYRKYPTGSHMIFYRLIESGIDVIRILHQRMDVDLHL